LIEMGRALGETEAIGVLEENLREEKGSPRGRVGDEGAAGRDEGDRLVEVVGGSGQPLFAACSHGGHLLVKSESRADDSGSAS
jgi:hypothetical protein